MQFVSLENLGKHFQCLLMPYVVIILGEIHQQDISFTVVFLVSVPEMYLKPPPGKIQALILEAGAIVIYQHGAHFWYQHVIIQRPLHNPVRYMLSFYVPGMAPLIQPELRHRLWRITVSHQLLACMQNVQQQVRLVLLDAFLPLNALP